MMRKKKWVSLGLVAALSASMLATGCGSSSGNSAGSTEGGSGDGKELSVFIFANEKEQDIYKNLIKEYQEAHSDTISNIDVQITTQDEYATTLTGMMTAGDMPDVFYVGPEAVKDYVENGYILDMEPYIDQLNIDVDNMVGVVDYYRYDGEVAGQGDLYAFPKDSSVFAYAYNKNLFDEAGLDYPDPEHPYTYDEFVEVCQKLTKDLDGDGEPDQWGCGFANAFMLYQFIWSNGASFCSDDYKTVTIDTDEFKDALQKYVDLTLKYKVTPTVEQDASLGVYQRWLAGQEGFYACGTWDVAAFMDKETFPYDWDLCAYPTLSTGETTTWLGTVGYCVSANTKDPEEAVGLANFLSTDPDGQRNVSGISTGDSVQLPNLVDMANGEFKEAVEAGTVEYPSNVEVLFNYLNSENGYVGHLMETAHTPNSEWMDRFFEGLDNVKNGSQTVDEYVAEVGPEMQELLDQAWADAE